jgi:flavin reductase (DIM6/NTAB) family NADH-FMN oxidoreductase RutF
MKLPPVDKDQFRRACSKFATGITVASVIGIDGAPHGLTVNSFTSVSLTPPLVLFCIDVGSGVLRHFRPARFFGINVLEEHQRPVSSHFARKGHDRFTGVTWVPGKTGVPLLPGALATLECRTVRRFAVGDHLVVIGQAVAVTAAHGGKPLLYFASGYHEIS